jgi:hypothetical protein
MAMPDATCPWCSAALPTPTPEHCPSCGAQLVSSASDDVPGVTQVDLGALTRGDPIVAPPRRGLLSFISGEYAVDEPVAPHEAIAPPPDEVRREMLRMEIEAAEAEAAAIQAELEMEAAAAAEASEAAAASEAAVASEAAETDGQAAGQAAGEADADAAAADNDGDGSDKA